MYLQLGEEKLGKPPVPYLWVACGSQARREQTSVGDQDNGMIISNEMEPTDDEYFAALAKFTCDGLDACGYYYCPGDVMATNPKWRQPLRVWKRAGAANANSPSSHNTWALARVACPQRSTSVVGVNQRSS